MTKEGPYDKQRAKLIELIKSLSPSYFYEIAPPQYVKRGYDYYRRGLLDWVEWEGDFLVATVFGTIPYEVKVRHNGDQLQTVCTCPAYTPLTNCKHIVCALISLKNLLNPEAFFPSPFSKHKRLELLECLEPDDLEMFEQADFQENLKLILSLEQNDIYYEQYGKEIRYIHHFPDVLKELPFSFIMGDITKKQINKAGVDIVLRYKKRDIPLKLKERLSLKPQIAFIAEGDKLKAKLHIKDKDKVQNGLLLLRTNILINPEEEYLSILGKAKRDVTDFFKDILPDDEESKFIRNRFHELSYSVSLPSAFFLVLKEKGARVVRESEFIVDGKSTALYEPEPEYSVDIVSYKEDRLVISLKIIVNGEELAFPFLPLVITQDIWRGAFGPLRAAEKRKLFYKAVFRMLEQRGSFTKKEMVDTLLEVFLEGQKYLSRQSYLKYRGFVSDVVEYIRDEEYNFSFFDNRWILLRTDISRCFGILTEIYNVLEPSDVIEVDPYDSSIEVKRDALHRNLGTLVSRLKDIGVQVTYSGKKIRQSTWDITIDFQKGIDWFELRPEIKVNDRAIPPEELHRLISAINSNMIETEDSIEVLPENVEEVLKLLGMGGRSKKGKKNKREIARIPRLQILNWLSLRKKGVNLRLPPEEEKIIDSLLNFKGIEAVKLPKGFRGRLRGYQKEGYYWLCFLYEHRFGACLADDMGLGKTIQAISFLAGIKEGAVGGGSKIPHLIVVPPTLLFNWESEIKRFYPSFSIYTYTGKDRTLKEKDSDIVITTYAIMRRDIEKLRKINFDVVIFDEAQAVKNIHAATTASARKLNARFKLALTGTPVENHIGEYFSIIDLCLPGLMGDYQEFMKAQKQNSKEFLDETIKRTAPFVLRRTKEEILKELPPKTETDIYLELTERQKALYTRTVKEIRKEIDEAYESKTQSQAQIVVLSALMKLRRLCLSPALIDSKLPAESPKIDLLVERLSILRQQGHSSLVFSQFTSYLDIVEERLKKSGFNVLRLDGSTPQKKRKELVKRFQEGEGEQVFLLSLKAGGQGLNLTRASYVIHLDPWWNPAVEQQATDRTHRIGQKQKVTVIRLLMQHTIEEKMQELKRRKKALYDALLGVRKSARGIKLSREDIEFLLHF